jgi:hypothetical protein
MSDDLATFRNGIQRFRTGGMAIAALPLMLGVALLLAGDRVPALEMLVVSVVLFFLILWATHCLEDAITTLQANNSNQKRE